jgi:hypothetical protein
MRAQLKIWPIVVIGISLVLPSCGKDSPSAPEREVPAAQLQSGVHQFFSNCTDPAGCPWAGEVRNVGIGCANRVRGTVQMEGSSGPVVYSFAWSLPPEQVIRPAETFLFTIHTTYPGTVVEAIGSTSVTYWENVGC